MKKMHNNSYKLHRLPVIFRVIVYLGVSYAMISLVQIIGELMHVRGEVFFNTTLCVILFIFTAFVLRWEGLSFKAIGVTADRGSFSEWLTGTTIGLAMLFAVAFILTIIVGFSWVTDSGFGCYEFFVVMVTVFASVVAQELPFRGYPFRLMIDRWGPWAAQLVTALLFGCMHLNDRMSGQEIAVTMFTTGLGSLLFGYAVTRTGRLHLAIGIHFGWNFLQQLLPRHPSQSGTGIWRIEGGNFDIGLVAWLAPYVIVVAVAAGILRICSFTRREDIPGDRLPVE